MHAPLKLPPADSSSHEAVDWHAQELLLLSQVIGCMGGSMGRSLATDGVLREMLHLMSELLGLNRGRIVLADDFGDTAPKIGRAHV